MSGTGNTGQAINNGTVSARSRLKSDSRTRGFYSKRGSRERELKRGGMRKEFELDFSFLCDPVNTYFCLNLVEKRHV